MQVDGDDRSDDHLDFDNGIVGPEGWKLYEPTDGGFTVFAPGPPEVSTEEIRQWKQRRYAFRDGDTPFVIEIYSERTGAVATNTVDDLRDSPDITAGSLREISLSGMPGIEFRTRGRAGEVVHREYCSADSSTSITIVVQKDVGGGISEKKVRQFLDSFKLKQ